MESDIKNNTQISTKNSGPISFFEQDSGFVFVYKKTEKLASAVYMVTGLFSDNEPMKWTLRKKSSDLMSFTLSYKGLSITRYEDFVHNMKTRVLEIVSLLEISNKGGLVSDMNFAILKTEFMHLLDVLSSSNFYSKELSQDSFSKDFFDVQNTGNSVQEKQVDKHAPAFLNTVSVQKISHTDVKDKNASAVKDEFKRTNRQNIILGLLKKKKELTIKDIAEVIKDCSEKTIQRELISFMSAGVIKRTGERRWSKYSLV